jgi:hypothetical protein
MSDERDRDDQLDVRAGADPIELALTRALEHRAGGPIDQVGVDAGASSGEPVGGPGRFEAIEAGTRAGGGSRQRLLLGAAAAVVVLALLTAAIVRSDEGTEVSSIGGEPSTTETSAPDPAAIDPAPGTSVVVDTEGPPSPEPPETSTTTVAPPRPDDIRLVDLRNFTFPTSVCEPLFDDLGSVAPDELTLVDGFVTVPYEVPDAPLVEFGTTLELTDVVYGDVTADGTEDAIVRLSCGLLASDGFVHPIVVVTLVDGVPTIVGHLHQSGLDTILDNVDPETGTASPIPAVDHILTVEAVGGHLVVRWLQGISQMGFGSFEQRETTVTYDWNESGFTPVAETDVVLIPAPGRPTVSEVEASSVPLATDHLAGS